MKVIVYCCLIGLNVLLFQPHAAVAQSTATWQRIDVGGLKEWSDPGKWWSEQDGIIVAKSEGGATLPKIHYLVWKGVLGSDFELQLEYRIMAKTPQDAGVNFRVDRDSGMNKGGNLIGYQAELDTAIMYSKKRFIRQGKLFGHIHDGKRGRMFKRGSKVTIDAKGEETTVALPNKFTPAKVFRKPPAWNECRIRVEGDLIQLYLNGHLANEILDKDAMNKSTGDAIALQFRPNGAYRFEVRNINYRSAGTENTK